MGIRAVDKFVLLGLGKGIEGERRVFGVERGEVHLGGLTDFWGFRMVQFEAR